MISAADMLDPALYAKDPARATSLNKQRADAAKTLASCEEDWLGLTEEHDAAINDLRRRRRLEEGASERIEKLEATNEKMAKRIEVLEAAR